MTDAADDFEALFDEVSAQRNVTAAEILAPPPAILSRLHPQEDEPSMEEPELQAEQESQAEKPMFERLGGIVRLLHDSLRELGYDKALSEASNKINDAQDRLEYIATLTEQAATKVLNTLDQAMPEQDALSKQAKDMDGRWTALFDGTLSVEAFKILAADSKAFAMVVSNATEVEKARLLDIMMAQDFQDITGQLIKKVVTITKTVEHELAQLLRDNAPPEIKEKLQAPQELTQGPAIHGEALAQDSVDDLLADLGF